MRGLTSCTCICQDPSLVFPQALCSAHRDRDAGLSAWTLQSWDEFFGHWLGPLPDALLTPPNAEFVATRAAIRRRPLEFYRAARRWLMLTPLPGFIAAMVMEYLWQLVLTGEAVRWPTQAECMCSLYGACLPAT